MRKGFVRLFGLAVERRDAMLVDFRNASEVADVFRVAVEKFVAVIELPAS